MSSRDFSSASEGFRKMRTNTTLNLRVEGSIPSRRTIFPWSTGYTRAQQSARANLQVVLSISSVRVLAVARRSVHSSTSIRPPETAAATALAICRLGSCIAYRMTWGETYDACAGVRQIRCVCDCRLKLARRRCVARMSPGCGRTAATTCSGCAP